MNSIVTNLTQIAAASEYFDRATGAAWKIRAALTNMGVWAANAVLAAQDSNNVEREASAIVRLATIRTWLHDANQSSFMLDLTPTSVANTLGLNREVDVHEEAVRVARNKCVQTRSAMNFKKFYDSAVAAIEEQRIVRQQRVEDIANMLSDTSTRLNPDLADHFNTFYHMSSHLDGDDNVPDSELYDDATVEREADRLSETVANALEAMWAECDTQLSAAITTAKVQRLSACDVAIRHMMEVVGVDTRRLKDRRSKLDEMINGQIELVARGKVAIEADIEAQLAEMTLQAKQEAAPEKPKARRVKKEDAVATM